MAPDVRPTTDLDEYDEALLAIGQFFGLERNAEGAERFAQNLPVERMLAARDNGSIVGGAGSFPFELSVPGGLVRCAGVTVVGVQPTHRRRGILRAMMRAQLDDLRDRGEPIAALWASEETIYGRFGYGMSALAGEIEIASEHTEFAAPLDRRGSVRFVEAEEAAKRFPAIWEGLARQRPGVFSRGEPWWAHRVFRDPPERRGGGGPKRFALLELDGADAAYAIYRHNPKWEDGSSAARLDVIEAVGTSPQATAEIWRFVLDMDWQATIAMSLLPVDHELFFLLAKPRRLRYRLGDGLWVRLVDVEQALSSRTYATDGELVVEIADAFAPWNEGRWRLADGRCERADDEPDLRCDVSALGSVYLGGFTFADLARALRVEELRPGAVDRADAIFRTSVAPWCPEIF